MESEEYPYQEQWEDYRKKQKAYWLGTLGFIPFVILLIFILNFFFNDNKTGERDVIFLVSLIYAGIGSVFAIRFVYWKCPRCGKSFHRKWWRQNVFSKECLHCKLPKYYGSTFNN